MYRKNVIEPLTDQKFNESINIDDFQHITPGRIVRNSDRIEDSKKVLNIYSAEQKNPPDPDPAADPDPDPDRIKDPDTPDIIDPDSPDIVDPNPPGDVTW